MTYDDLAAFPDGMIRIVVNPGERIAENRQGFFERDAMLSQIRSSFLRIPLKLHGRSVREVAADGDAATYHLVVEASGSRLARTNATERKNLTRLARKRAQGDVHKRRA